MTCQSGNTAFADCLLKDVANAHALKVFNETALLKADQICQSNIVKLLQKNCQSQMRMTARAVTFVGNVLQTLTAPYQRISLSVFRESELIFRTQ